MGKFSLFPTLWGYSMCSSRTTDTNYRISWVLKRIVAFCVVLVVIALRHCQAVAAAAATAVVIAATAATMRWDYHFLWWRAKVRTSCTTNRFHKAQGKRSASVVAAVAVAAVAIVTYFFTLILLTFDVLFGSYKHSKLIRPMLIIIIKALRFACFPLSSSSSSSFHFVSFLCPSFFLSIFMSVVHDNFTESVKVQNFCHMDKTPTRCSLLINVLIWNVDNRIIRCTQNFRSIYFQ